MYETLERDGRPGNDRKRNEMWNWKEKTKRSVSIAMMKLCL